MYVQYAFAATVEETLSSFTHVVDLPPTQIVVPTVVEVPFDMTILNKKSFAVYEFGTKKLLPYAFIERYVENTTLIRAMVDGEYVTNLTDGREATSDLFPLPLDGQEGRVEVILSSEEPIRTSRLILNLDTNVSLPTSVELRL
jgi:hypothetical protein